MCRFRLSSRLGGLSTKDDDFTAIHAVHCVATSLRRGIPFVGDSSPIVTVELGVGHFLLCSGVPCRVVLPLL